MLAQLLRSEREREGRLCRAFMDANILDCKESAPFLQDDGEHQSFIAVTLQCDIDRNLPASEGQGRSLDRLNQNIPVFFRFPQRKNEDGGSDGVALLPSQISIA